MTRSGRQDTEILLSRFPVVVWDLILSHLNNLRGFLCTCASSNFFYNILKYSPRTEFWQKVDSDEFKTAHFKIKPFMMKNGVKYPIIVERNDRAYALAVVVEGDILGFEAYAFQSQGPGMMEDSMNIVIKTKEELDFGATIPAYPFVDEPDVLEMDLVHVGSNIKALKKRYEAAFGETAESDMKINCYIKIVDDSIDVSDI